MYKLIKKFFETGIESNELSIESQKKAMEAFNVSIMVNSIIEENSKRLKKIDESTMLMNNYSKFKYIYDLEQTAKILKVKKYKSANDKAELAKTLASLKFFEDNEKN